MDEVVFSSSKPREGDYTTAKSLHLEPVVPKSRTTALYIPTTVNQGDLDWVLVKSRIRPHISCSGNRHIGGSVRFSVETQPELIRICRCPHRDKTSLTVNCLSHSDVVGYSFPPDETIRRRAVLIIGWPHFHWYPSISELSRQLYVTSGHVYPFLKQKKVTKQAKLLSEWKLK